MEEKGKAFKRRFVFVQTVSDGKPVGWAFHNTVGEYSLGMAAPFLVPSPIMPVSEKGEKGPGERAMER